MDMTLLERAEYRIAHARELLHLGHPAEALVTLTDDDPEGPPNDDWIHRTYENQYPKRVEWER